MSISSEITRITGAIADTYTAASGKGATMPATQNADNLASCVGSIIVPQIQTNKATVTPTTSQQTIRPDSGFDGMNPVILEPIPSQYADVSGDTVTAADLMGGVIAHGATGSPIAGTIIDGFTKYKSDLLNLGTSASDFTNLNNWVLDLGFVPKFFMIYTVDEYYELGNLMRVSMLYYNRFRTVIPSTYSGLRRMIGAAQWSGYSPRAYSYSDTARVEPYKNGNVKGIIGVVSNTTVYFRLIGQYRYIAFG